MLAGTIDVVVPFRASPVRTAHTAAARAQRRRDMEQRETTLAPTTLPVRGVSNRKRSRAQAGLDSEDSGESIAAEQPSPPPIQDALDRDYIHFQEVGQKVVSLFVSYYAVDHESQWLLRRLLARQPDADEAFDAMLGTTLPSVLPYETTMALRQRARAQAQVAERARSSLLFQHVVEQPLPCVFGVAFDDWNLAFGVSPTGTPAHLSAEFVARLVLQLLADMDEWVEPDVVFPRIVDPASLLSDGQTALLEQTPDGKQAALMTETLEHYRKGSKHYTRLLSLSQQDANVEGHSAASSSSTGTRAARLTPDDTALADMQPDFARYDWNTPASRRIIPMAILPFMFLAMGKTRDRAFQLRNHPFGILEQGRLFLQRIRTLFVEMQRPEAVVRYTRETAPLTFYAATQADAQCERAFELLAQYYGPLDEARIENLHVAQKLPGILNTLMKRIAQLEELLKK